jgi:hypothetical protein
VICLRDTLITIKMEIFILLFHTIILLHWFRRHRGRMVTSPVTGIRYGVGRRRGR